MFRLVTIEDFVRIPPERFKEPLEKVAKEIIRSEYEGKAIKDLGIVVAIINIKVSKVGKVVPTDGASYHKVVFDALVFYPQLQEVIEGEVVGVVPYGAFVRIGPIDALLHISQIGDDRFRNDPRREALIGEKTQYVLGKGDRVRARIVSVSMPGPSPRPEPIRVGLTMRQPFLGKLEWIEEELRKLKARARS
ncbi:MAG: DNA-directed RNA polymerase [Thermoprotei archaeon]|nr:MAG: DNA-directed RNA polymerase [Thermoprotei archaeon]